MAKRAEQGETVRHAAWNFMGYITFDKIWIEKIAQFHEIIDTISGNSIEEVINEANSRHGSD